MSKLRIIFIIVMAGFLTACGGGGGSSGVTNAGGLVGPTGANGIIIQETSLNLQLKDTGGAITQSVAAAGGAEIVATLTTKAGVAIAGQRIVFDDFGVSSLISFPDGKSVTTDQNGLARLKITRLSLTKFGSGIVSASFGGTLCFFYSVTNCTTIQFASASSDISVRVDPPTLRLELLDAANAPTNSISSSALTSIRATLRFADGTSVTQKRVEIAGDLTKVSFPEGSSQLTDATGIAIIKVARAAVNVSGAGSLNGSAVITGADASGSVDRTVVTGGVDYQVGVANIALSQLNLGTGPLAAFGNRSVSVRASINGVAATNNPVQVTFGASCGTTLPTTVTTNSEGIASATYSASSAACAGSNVNITASTIGAPSLAGTIVVANSIATNIQFVSTTPQLIYLKGSTGTTQAQAVFKVVDSNGTPLQNQKVRISLSNTSTGVTLNTLGNTAPFDFTTDSAGVVSAAVFSGSVPTSLNVKAVLLDGNNAETSVSVNSNLLNVASGLPTQRSVSLAVEKLSIEGGNLDGVTTNVTFSMADRQGNPVPPGTQVNFVSESGVFLPAVCFVPPVTTATATTAAIPTSSCTVTLRSQGTRTLNGRVSILAYVVGEEDFVDRNGNNVYDIGEAFTDLGRAFRDDNAQHDPGADNVFSLGEFQVPRESTPACVVGIGCSGDGVWGAADVRGQNTVVFASSQASITAIFGASVMILDSVPAVSPSTTITPASFVTPGLDVTIRDTNNIRRNSVPTGSTIAISVSDNTPNDPVIARGSLGATCTLSSPASTVVPNTLNSLGLSIVLKNCTSRDSVNVVVTTPLGFVTSRTFILP